MTGRAVVAGMDTHPIALEFFRAALMVLPMTAMIQFSLALDVVPEDDSAPVWSSVAAEDVPRAFAEEALTWVHFDANDPELPAWLEENVRDIDETALDALTQSETRPWAGQIGNDLLVVLRTVNLTVGMDREDMLGIRVWADQRRIITMSRSPIMALEEIAAEALRGDGFTSTGAFLSLLTERLTDHLEPFIRDLDQEVDELEEKVIGAPDRELRRRMVRLRLSLVELRRHLLPQSNALASLQACNTPVLSTRDRRNILRSHNRLIRLNENLDELRDNLIVLRDELAGQLSDEINRHMYALSIISVVFLPLTFLTGLFGINVDGIPGAENPVAFGIFAGVMILLLGGQFMLLRRLRWI